MAQLKTTTIDGSLTLLNDNLYLDNGNSIFGLNTGGENRSLVQMNASNQAVFGYGGYSNNEGASYFDGNNVNIRSKNGVYITSPNAGLNAREYGVNKVLWSGGYYMTSGHTVTLSETVTAQPNGIVLVFSLFNTTAQDANFHTFFIPKYMIQTHPGMSYNFAMGISGFDIMCNKLLRINNTTITGADSNNASGTGATGVTYNNAKWVLRYVIGV